VVGVAVGSRNTCYRAARYGLTRTGLAPVGLHQLSLAPSEIQASRAPFLFAMPKVDKTKAGTRNLDKEVGQWECLEYGKVASVFINKAEETV